MTALHKFLTATTLCALGLVSTAARADDFPLSPIDAAARLGAVTLHLGSWAVEVGSLAARVGAVAVEIGRTVSADVVRHFERARRVSVPVHPRHEPIVEVSEPIETVVVVATRLAPDGALDASGTRVAEVRL